MAHAIWTGAINFGLVSIPVKLYTAVREHDVHFNQLHAKDRGRIHNLRRCEECNEEVNWEDLIRGYQFEKGQYVEITDEDFEKVNPEATQSITIQQFVALGDINPLLFDKPYYLEPEKKGAHAYALLREGLKKSGKVGIGKVVIRSREYVAAVKPDEDALVLELMHFADEVVSQDTYDLPAKEHPSEGEMKAVMMLIDAMAAKYDPEQYKDTYRDQLMEVIEAKVQGRPLPKPEVKPRPKAEVVNLIDVLQRSLREQRKAGGAAEEAAPAQERRGRPRHRAAAATRGRHRKAG